MLPRPPLADDRERGRQIALGFLAGVAKVTRACRLSMNDVSELFEVALFLDARQAGMKLAEISELFHISPRKAAQMSKRAKTLLADRHPDLSLPRRVEFLLWSEPLSRARIAQALPGEEETAIDEALDQLVTAGRLRLAERSRSSVYERVHENSRLVSADDQSRLDGLRHAIGVLSSAVFGRFFREEPKALYRTISFYARSEDVPRLRQHYNALWDLVQELEEHARQDPNAIEMEVSMTYAPADYLAEKNQR